MGSGLHPDLLQSMIGFDTFSATDVLAVATVGGFVIDAANYQYTQSVDNKQKDTCDKVNELLNVPSLGDTADDEVNPPSGTYAYCCGVAAKAEAITGLSGATIGPGVAAAAASGMLGTALTFDDFGTFRGYVASAISKLDQKIDEIINVSVLS